MELRFTKKSPREQSEDISKDKEKPHHIGKKSGAVLQQEFFSLINVKEAFRNKKWWDNWKELDKNLSTHNPSLRSSLESKYGNLGRIPRG